MKKLLGIVVLGLLLSENAYAATKYTYLSCKAIIKKNDSKDAAFSSNNDHLKIGSNNGHYFYKFKDNKSDVDKIAINSFILQKRVYLQNS